MGVIICRMMILDKMALLLIQAHHLLIISVTATQSYVCIFLAPISLTFIMLPCVCQNIKQHKQTNNFVSSATKQN